MPTKADFFTELKDWSERKIKLVTNYIDSSARILGSNSSYMYYVDGFAGPGIYRNGATGSPVRMAELAQLCEIEDRPYRLRCINVEQRKRRFANLQEATARFDSHLVTNLRGQFSTNAEHILTLIGSKPTVFFLDPFGIKGIPWAIICEITARAAATDIWIRLSEHQVRRVEGFYGGTTLEAVEKYEGTLCDLYGIPDPDTLHDQLAAPTVEGRLERARELYKERLRDEIGRKRGTGYVGSYSIRSAATDQHKYALVFGTAHPKGITLASDVAYNIEKSYRADRDEVTQQPGLFASIPSKSTQGTHGAIDRMMSENLATTIHTRFQGRAVDREMIHTELTCDQFGEFGKTHLTAALKLLIDRHDAQMRTGRMSDDHARFEFTRPRGRCSA